MTVVAKERTHEEQTRQERWLDQLWPGEDRPLTVDDLERTPDDGNRYELVNGVLVVTPAPNNTHNLVATRLSTLLMLQSPVGFRTVTVLGLNIAEGHHRIPDIGVVRTKEVLPGAKYPDTPPALIIEVASPSTYKQDRTSKLNEYAAVGIDAYWLVTPDLELTSLTAYRLRDSKYELEANVAGEEVFRTDAPFPFSLAPALLVADDERWRALLPRLTE